MGILPRARARSGQAVKTAPKRCGDETRLRGLGQYMLAQAYCKLL